MSNLKLTIQDGGDPSCGIFPCYYEIDCPFDLDADDEIRQNFIDDQKKAFAEYAEGPLLAAYSDEIWD